MDGRQAPPSRPNLPALAQAQLLRRTLRRGAPLFFLRPVPAEVEVLSDVNGDLVNLYRVVQHHLEEFVRQFKWALSSR